MDDPSGPRAELERARALDIESIADTIQEVGFECTHCGACCTGTEENPHTATVFPGEIERILDSTGDDWRDVARPMPFGLDADGTGRTYEWALATGSCGDCTFFESDDSNGGRCSIYPDRPLICRTYPFSLALSGTAMPMGAAVDRVGPVQIHECEGIGAEIDRPAALELARTLKRRAIRDLEEFIAVRQVIEDSGPRTEPIEVIDSVGRKRPDGTVID